MSECTSCEFSLLPRIRLTILSTFMTISQPSWFVRALVLGAQGVFYNAFFLTYLLSPRTAHRFVGCLEEGESHLLLQPRLVDC